MSQLIRRPNEYLRHRVFRLPFGDPAEDRGVIAAGGTVRVAAWLTDSGNLIRGWLLVRNDPAAPIAWVSRQGARSSDIQLLTAPVSVRGFGPRVGTERYRIKSAFSMLMLDDATGSWRFAIPTVDVALLRYILR